MQVGSWDCSSWCSGSLSHIPDQDRIESITDIEGLDAVISTERRLLYVACTRASDSLWASGVEPASEFLDELENS